MAMGLGCTARPGRSRENKTGSWRVFRPMFIHEGCIGEDDEGLPVTDYDYCKGCGLCAEECPGEAIEMKKEEK
jgi:pyruvate ferredoxin oxidoreductase delta subunit